MLRGDDGKQRFPQRIGLALQRAKTVGEDVKILGSECNETKFCQFGCIIVISSVISFNAKASGEDQNKHQNFVKRMVEKGYTEKQVRLLSEWYLRVRKSS